MVTSHSYLTQKWNSERGGRLSPIITRESEELVGKINQSIWAAQTASFTPSECHCQDSALLPLYFSSWSQLCNHFHCQKKKKNPTNPPPPPPPAKKKKTHQNWSKTNPKTTGHTSLSLSQFLRVQILGEYFMSILITYRWTNRKEVQVLHGPNPKSRWRISNRWIYQTLVVQYQYVSSLYLHFQITCPSNI